MKRSSALGEACWRRKDILKAAHTLCYFERASAHILAGWLPKIADINTKVTLGLHQYVAMDNAMRLHKAISGFNAYKGEWDFSVPEGFRQVMVAIDASATGEELVAGLYLHVKKQLIAGYRELLRNTDRVLDHNLIALLEPMLASNQEQVKWATRRLASPKVKAKIRAATQRIRALWSDRQTAATVGEDQWLWAPLDRVTRPARPAKWEQKAQGQIGRVAYRDLDPEHICKSFHGNTDEEICTMELFARCSYEHPDMPLQFHSNMARQVADEARHTLGCIDLITEFGARYGDYPISTGVYNFHYQFEACEPGGKRELLWRLLLRSTVQEALSLDGFRLQIKKREYCQQERIARLLESIMSDEIFHVNSGNTWTRHLCGDDPQKVMQERSEAHTYYVDHVTRVRRAFVYANPEVALAELDYVRKETKKVVQTFPFSLKIHINTTARRAAGFTEPEMQQVIDWGYALPESDALALPGGGGARDVDDGVGVEGPAVSP